MERGPVVHNPDHPEFNRASEIIGQINRGESTLKKLDEIYEVDKVLWLKSCMALVGEREIESITDEELLARLVEGGPEWDPAARDDVRKYLRERGCLS